VLELCRLLIVPRAGHATHGADRVIGRYPGREDRFAFLAGPLLPISGSVVRRRLAAGRSVRYLVPDPVIRYLTEHRLYARP
jgi:nicotinate-nucleotide adenylyltransferase